MKLITKSVLQIVFMIIVGVLVIVSCYAYMYQKIYSDVYITSSIVEYGSSNNDFHKLLNCSEEDAVSIIHDIDTSQVGIQQFVVEVSNDYVSRIVSIDVDVKDTVAPEIKLKEDAVSIVEGDSYDVLSNLESVSDRVDGQLTYQMDEIVNEDTDTNYYTVVGDVNTNQPGVYELVVKAVDQYGNISTATFPITVTAKATTTSFINHLDINDSYVSTANTSDIVSIAYSLVGSPYIAGGASPLGFDCSGFVQYVYAMAGISISRSTSTQIYDGVGVSYENAMPGDILSWGYVNGVPTHSAIYIGDGKMIHATNPRQGVIVSDVMAWTRGSGSHVIAVRRI